MHSWRSQPIMRGGALLGNIKMAGAIVLSGNNYQKIALLCKFLNLGLLSSYSFYQIQSHYVLPSVEKLWEKVKGTAQEELGACNVVVSGDGRMDSPGHSAKYCTYTVIDQASKKRIGMEVVDKRECELISGRMEAAAFQRVLADIQNAGMLVSEFVTDAHPQIASIMKKQYPQIRHSWDMWHGAKNLSKKLCAVSQEKGNAALKPWMSSVTNHFYYAAEHCETSDIRLKIKLAEILNHCADKHTWILGQCDHGELDEASRDKEWIDPCSSEFMALEKVLFDARFLSTMRYYVTCQTTSELESFNSHLLMYADKRQSFTYGVYKARCQLAAIDYMMHLERPYKTNKNGEQYFNRAFSKAANQWVVKPVKEKKEYAYIPDLLIDIISAYCDGSKKVRDPIERNASDPIQAAKTIAPKQPPETKKLVETREPRLRLKAGTSKEALE